MQYSYKYTKVLVLACFVIAILNMLYFTYDRRREVVPELTEDADSMLKEYHIDTDGELVVVEQCSGKDKSCGTKENGAIPASEFREKLAGNGNGNGSDNNQTMADDMLVINGYNYGKLGKLGKSKNIGDFKAIEDSFKFRQAFVAYMSELLEIIDECKPAILGINNDEHYILPEDEKKEFKSDNGKVPMWGWHLRENYLDDPVPTKKLLGKYLQLSQDEISLLKESHDKFMKKIPDHFPESLLKAGRGSGFMKGDGIMYLGGGKYDQLVLLSIRILRQAGSQLPVEVIIPTRDEYDLEFCNDILPHLNGRCKVMADFLPGDFIDNIKGFQLKSVALLVSSFKNVLYIDSDNVPIKNVDQIFTNEPFTSKHLVVWPDFWRRTTSPLWYDIAGVKTNGSKRVRNSYFLFDDRGIGDKILFHDCEGTIPEASSESGQLLINKEVHLPTLILSLFYNVHGPDYFYPLLSQGAAGEGDKETFIAAAHKLNIPYYQVQEFTREFGPLTENNRVDFYSMGQYDPIIDYIQSRNPEKYANRENPTYAKDTEDSETNNYDYHKFASSNLMFLHANWPKFFLGEMVLNEDYTRGFWKDDERRRLYNKKLMDELKGFDLEKHMVKLMNWWFCDIINLNILDAPEPGSYDRKRACTEIKEQLKFLNLN